MNDIIVEDESYFSLLSSGSWVRIPPGTQNGGVSLPVEEPVCHIGKNWGSTPLVTASSLKYMVRQQSFRRS